MRVSEKTLDPSLKKEIEDVFAQVITDLKDLGETKTFLKDFFNESEMEVFVKRLAIMYWLKKKTSYSNIKNDLKVSSATVASVQNTLNKPGIKLALKKIEAEEWANVWAEKIRKFTKLNK
jgi:uncharacterized protein YerC